MFSSVWSNSTPKELSLEPELVSGALSLLVPRDHLQPRCCSFMAQPFVVHAGVFEVRATSGNTHLGGEDFDQRLMKYCISQVCQSAASWEASLQVIALYPCLKSKESRGDTTGESPKRNTASSPTSKMP